MTEAYPLAWPDGWPRTAAADRKDGRYSFKRPASDRFNSREPWTFAQARDALLEEAWKHTSTSVVLSSNFQPGRSGPVEGRRRPDDQAVALYFQRKGQSLVMASDRYSDAEGNMRSLTLALEAMRQLDRHGGGMMMDRAYQGFLALPAPIRWWEVLGVSPAATVAEIQAAYRVRARTTHPNASTGSEEAMAELNIARDAGVRAAQERS